MRTYDAKSYANTFLVFIFILAFGFFANKLGFWKNAANAALMTSIILVSATLFLGPLSRIFPKRFEHDLLYRKPLGIAGFFFSALYFLIMLIIIFRFDFMRFFDPLNYFANIYLFLGLITLLALYIISHPRTINEISFTRWKSVQGWGYAALIFLLVHFVFVDNSFFLRAYSGKTVLLFGVLAIAAKFVVIALDLRKKHSDLEISRIGGHS